MKHFVINLERRSDRLEWWKEQNDYIKNYTVFKAFDGKSASYEQVLKMGFDVNKSWRDPKHGTRLTDGEVGCFISHYMLWKICSEQDEPFFISEDDICTPEREYDIAKSYINNYDFVYIGQVDANSDKAEDIDDLVYAPAYPLNLSSYVLTPKAAKLLLSSNVHKNIIPADEYVPRVMKTDIIPWCAIKNSEVVGYVNASDVSYGGLNTEGTNVTPFNCFKTHVLTVGTDLSQMDALNISSNVFDINVKNLGHGVDWQGNSMNNMGGGHKINLVKPYLETLPEDDIVLFTDGYDTFFSSDLDEILKRYFEFKKEIVIGAEKYCWPDESLSNQFDLTQDYPYLNSGTYIGTVRELKRILSKPIQDNDDDQLYLQLQYLQGNYSVGLDHGQYIFMTMDEENLVIKNGDTYNSKVRTYGCLVHGNGGDTAKQHFNKLFRQISSPQSPLFIKNYGKFDIIHDDMLLIDFMTKSQCERLIEISDTHGGWEPLPGDKFPAYEIRMKELGLWDELEQQWVNEIYPVIEDYWHPLKMYGLRDAFTMRYSLDTQTSLNNHHDASLVTGSVKLNDDYEGAKLIFPRQGVTNDVAEVGQCILFPGQVTHGHYCDELKGGVKYSLTMWTSRYDGDVN